MSDIDSNAVLRAYAQLSGEEGPVPTDVIGAKGVLVNYPYSSSESLLSGKRSRQQPGLSKLDHFRTVDALLARAELEQGSNGQLRLGWIWFTGTTEVDGENVTWCFPGLSAPVSRRKSWLGFNDLESVGDTEITPLVTDADVRSRLASGRQFGGGALFETFVTDTRNVLHWDQVDRRILDRMPLLRTWVLDIAQAVGLPAPELTMPGADGPADGRGRPGIRAFISPALYIDDGPAYSSSRRTLERLSKLKKLDRTAFASVYRGNDTTREHPKLHHLRPMSARQEQVVENASADDLSVISGPPGTGKTHLIVVAALGAAARGESVLVVASSKYAVDVLVDYFGETPGPPPVIFDGSARSRENAFALTELASLRHIDIGQADALLDHANETEARFFDLFGAAGSSQLLTELVDHLYELDEPIAAAHGEKLSAQRLVELKTHHRTVLSSIGYALSSTRGERAESFRESGSKALTEAAPLWIGTVEDIERVLPEDSAMFDLVIVDEAAQANPMDMCGPLVRAEKALVVGDPQQLGHSSFLSDEEISTAAVANRLDPEAINPRKQSLFDLAAAKVPPQVLTEHFRSAPHLIEFSSRRFYGGSLDVMTRNLQTDAADHIDVSVVDGVRNAAKVNEAEVDECMSILRSYAEKGWSGIGLLSPFRAQADALEEAVLEEFLPSELDRLDMRVGTAHSFQGDERRLMITSWAVGTDEGDRAWQFVNQERLFNVMITRARDHQVIVTSNPKPPGLAGEYLRWAEPFTDLGADDEVADSWVRSIADALVYGDIELRTGYRVGEHTIDIAALIKGHNVAIVGQRHPNGAAAHLERGLQLRRVGWTVIDAFEDDWRDNAAGFLVDLLGRFPDIAV